MSKGFAWLIVLFIVLALAILGGGGYAVFRYYHSRTCCGIKTSSNVNVNSNSGWETYKNTNYGFSFQYPASWKKTKKEETTLPGPAGNDFVFGVSFYDPVEKKKIDCANTDYQGTWEGASVTQVECQSILSQMSATEKEKYRGSRAPQGIYAYVFKNSNNQLVYDWLNATYKIANTELQDYAPGKQITLDGESGYLSSIGCCSESNRNYTVAHNNYFYELGTTYFETRLGETEMPPIFLQIVDTFKFTN